MDLLGQWLKVSLCLCCNWAEWLGACCVSRVIYQVCREERQRRRNGETTPVAGRQQLPASWPGVLTPHLTSMGTEQPPLLSSLLPADCGNKRDRTSPSLTLLLAGLLSSGNWPWTEQDMTGLDSFGSETSAGDPGSEDCTDKWFWELKWHSWLSQAVSQAAMQFSCQLLASQMVS